MALQLLRGTPMSVPVSDATTEVRERVATLMLGNLPATIPVVARCYGADRSKAIRDLFRLLGWTRLLRVTKGGWTVGTDIEWHKGTWPDERPRWGCSHMREWTRNAETDNPHAFFQPPMCGCEEHTRAQQQQDAIRRRVFYVLARMFANDKTFGDRSDTMTDYFDSDYSFFP